MSELDPEMQDLFFLKEHEMNSLETQETNYFFQRNVKLRQSLSSNKIFT